MSEHPLADLYIARAADALGPRYKPLRGRASWAVRLLVVTAAVNALSFLVELRDRSLLDASQPGLFGRLTSYDAHQALLLDAFLATMLATVVVFLCWLHRAHRNASQLGSDELRCSSRMAIGIWFVPILNLWRPKHVLDDVWRGSDPDGSQSSDLILLWWGLFLVSGIIANIASRMSMATLADVRAQNTVDLVAYALRIGAAVAAAVLVRRITDRQERRAQLVAAA